MQPSITVDHKGIGKALAENYFRVPPHQREYAWEREHIEDLFRDLADAEDEANQPEYFLGMIVLTRSEDGASWIADGQQRLATTSILLAAIRDWLRENNEPEFAKQINSMFLQAPALGSHDATPKLHLNIADNEYYRTRILDYLGTPRRSGVDSRVARKRIDLAASLAATHVRERVKSNSHQVQVEKLMKMAAFIRDKVTIMLVTAPDDLGAFRMFETLNDRGLEAAQSDLVKSYLMGLADQDGRAHEVLQKWTSMMASLGPKSSATVVRYLRHYYYSEYGHAREHQLFSKIREKIHSSPAAASFADDLAVGAADYDALWRSDDDKWHEYGATTRQHIEILKILRVDQLRPLHLAVVRRFPVAEARKAFRLFVACSARLAIGGGSKIGRIDRECAERAVKVGREITTTKQLAVAMAEIVPTDAEFEPNFAVATTSRAELARYVLRALELQREEDPTPELVPNANQDMVNLEHILPKHPGLGWSVDPKEADDLVNRYGNYVLLRKTANKMIGNDSFADKRQVFRASTYSLTSDVAKSATWNADTIAARQKKMAKLAVKTWPIAVS